MPNYISVLVVEYEQFKAELAAAKAEVVGWKAAHGALLDRRERCIALEQANERLRALCLRVGLKLMDDANDLISAGRGEVTT